MYPSRSVSIKPENEMKGEAANGISRCLSADIALPVIRCRPRCAACRAKSGGHPALGVGWPPLLSGGNPACGPSLVAGLRICEEDVLFDVLFDVIRCYSMLFDVIQCYSMLFKNIQYKNMKSQKKRGRISCISSFFHDEKSKNLKK